MGHNKPLILCRKIYWVPSYFIYMSPLVFYKFWLIIYTISRFRHNAFLSLGIYKYNYSTTFNPSISRFNFWVFFYKNFFFMMLVFVLSFVICPRSNFFFFFLDCLKTVLIVLLSVFMCHNPLSSLYVCLCRF